MRSARVTPNTVATPADYNALVNDTAGASRLLAHQMYGTIALPTNPTNTKTLTLDINGTNITITFVSSIGSTAGNVLIGATAAATAANLLQLLLNPTISNSTQVAIGTNTSANVTLINYVNWSLTATSIIPSSYNSTLYAPATSFSASTTVTGGSYTANTMALFVEPGVVFVNGTEVYFAGAVTGTVTAPVSHPRIDVLSMDNTGTLNWTTGTEASSPTTPTYPSNQIPICELYNVVSETALYDNANQQSGAGYILNDVRPFLAYPIPLGAIPDNLLPATDATYNLGSASFEWNNVYVKTAVIVNGASVAVSKFGGSGSDGALSINSGTTTINASSATYVEKNYTSISITSTGTLTFSTPNTNGTFMALRSQGAVTLTSSSAPMINASAMGAAGGANPGGGNVNGNAGKNGNPFYLLATQGGQIGSGGAGSGGVPPTTVTPTLFGAILPLKYGGQFWVGGGGASGGSTNGASTGQGAGGIGGGCLLIECGGAFNFTTSGGISVAGGAGTNTPDTTYGGGGGGGGGGFFMCLYNQLTANSGTVTVSAGSSGSSGSNAGFHGALGGSGVNANGVGTSIILQNTSYA